MGATLFYTIVPKSDPEKSLGKKLSNSLSTLGPDNKQNPDFLPWSPLWRLFVNYAKVTRGGGGVNLA